MNKPIRYGFFLLAVLFLIGLALVTVEFILTRGTTPRIGGSQSIASLEQVELGGTAQWVLIRGHDSTKPVLLFLHAGPGMPAMFLAHAFQPDLEHDFNTPSALAGVVQLSGQNGLGAAKSMIPAKDAAPLTG